jgi:two-component system nitrate/nitrite response regulator NarL
MPLDNITENIRVLVADDHPVFREGLRMLLETDPNIQVVGEASDGKEAARLASELKPNLVLLDLRMPGCSGMEALRLIQRLSLPARILILATEVRKPEIIEALSHGASGIVLKETATHLLRKSISTVMAGQYWIEREGVTDLALAVEKGSSAVSRSAPNKKWRLTPREEQIVAEVVAGKTNNEVAETLGVSAQTVKHHLTSIFDKIGVYNRLELALFCVNHSFMTDGSPQDAEPDAVPLQDRTDTRDGETDNPTSRPSEPLRFSAAERDARQGGARSQAAPDPLSSEAKRIPFRNMR